MKISVQKETFDCNKEIKLLVGNNSLIGAISSFIGLVREFNHDIKDSKQIKSIVLEHYPGMTQKSLKNTLNIAKEKHHITNCTIIHRIGELKICDPIVLIICASPHRTDAINACSYIIDQLKIQTPFWKKEVFTDNTHQWVEQKKSDIQKSKSYEELTNSSHS